MKLCDGERVQCVAVSYEYVYTGGNGDVRIFFQISAAAKLISCVVAKKCDAWP